MEDHTPAPAGGTPGERCGRRQALAGLAAVATTASAGCIRSAASVLGRDAPRRASVAITTLPADDDPKAVRIARYLAEHLEAVGVATRVQPMQYAALLREVLLNQDFDLYVAEHPGGHEPDFLRSLLHSQFAEESGWQNPTGYAELEVDELLDTQRRLDGSARRSALYEVQLAAARDQPFAVIAFPDAVGAFRTDRFEGGGPWRLQTPFDYLSVPPLSTGTAGSGGSASSNGSTPVGRAEPTTLRVAMTDQRPTENLNPLSVEYRGDGTVTGLLYDSLGRWREGTVQPWLAASWEWSDRPDGGLRGSVTLRDDLTWHDGEPLTAADVAFTYRFLHDTSLGEQQSPIPTTRFRGRSSLVRDAQALDDTSLRLHVAAGSRAVAERSLTVPVLPAHVWEERTRPATVAGIDARETVTEALVWNNLAPVGSGPLQFEGLEPRTQLTLRRFDDHFLHRGGLDDGRLTPYRVGYDRLRFVAVPSGAAGVELLTGGDVDAMAEGIDTGLVPRIGRSPYLQLSVTPAPSFYHLGFNVRRRPFSNPRFRRAVAQLLDKPFLVDDVFDGFGTPAASPLARLGSVPPRLRWEGEDPELPFPGREGDLDVGLARDAFREAGYRYSNDGALLLN